MVGYEWCEREENYLKQLHDMCIKQSRDYMILYRRTHRKQTQLRLPAIILSSFSGVASFGTSSFPQRWQKYVSIAVGILNISIAMIQTYESYLKIGDVVSKALAVSTGLKKLSDDIYCEVFIPVQDRELSGITFLRDAFNRYQTIVENAPPMYEHMVDVEEDKEEVKKQKRLVTNITMNLRNEEERCEFGKTFRRTTLRATDDFEPLPLALPLAQDDHVYSPGVDVHVNVREVIGDGQGQGQPQ